MKAQSFKNIAIGLAVLIAGIAYGGTKVQQLIYNRHFNQAQAKCGKEKDNDANFTGFNICMTWHGFGYGGYGGYPATNGLGG